MAKPVSVELSKDEFDKLFLSLEIAQKVADGRLTAVPIVRASRPSWAHAGGTSEIVRHRNQLGFQVATSHRIIMPDASVPHSHGKDLHIGDIVLWRGEP